MDVLVKKHENSLHTEVFKKETDRNTFLQFNSFHSPALKRSLPYSQLLRMKRICNSDASFEFHAKNLCVNFKERGYGEALLENHLNRVRQVQRSDLLKPSSRDTSTQDIAFVSTYSPISKSVKETVSRYWHILESDFQINNAFQTPPRYFYKRSSNLSNFLVKSDMPKKRPTHFFSHSIPSGNFPCHNCVHCHAMLKGSHFSHPRSSVDIKVRGRITCYTRYVVYLLKCPCNLYYVGKTKRELKTRICEHKCSIRNHDDKSSVARHFNSLNHSLSDLHYMGIETVNMPRRGGDRDKILLQRETYWIHYLDTLIPKGLNEEILFSCFL